MVCVCLPACVHFYPANPCVYAGVVFGKNHGFSRRAAPLCAVFRGFAKRFLRYRKPCAAAPLCAVFPSCVFIGLTTVFARNGFGPCVVAQVKTGWRRVKITKKFLSAWPESYLTPFFYYIRTPTCSHSAPTLKNHSGTLDSTQHAHSLARTLPHCGCGCWSYTTVYSYSLCFLGNSFCRVATVCSACSAPARTLPHCPAQCAECPARVVCAVPAALRSDLDFLEKLYRYFDSYFGSYSGSYSGCYSGISALSSIL